MKDGAKNGKKKKKKKRQKGTKKRMNPRIRSSYHIAKQREKTIRRRKDIYICKTQGYTRRVMQPPARRDLWMKVERDGPKRRDTTQDTGNPDLEFLLMHIPTEYRRSFFLWTNCRLQQRHSHFLLSFFHLEYEWISAAYSMIQHTT